MLNLLFSYLNEEFSASGLSFGAIVGAFYVVGFLVFQFPPAPGLPVFYACAVILTQSAMNAGYGFWEGWAIATAVSVALKYSSLISGQMIGHLWGAYSVRIRKTVNVNSSELRAIKYILLQQGFTRHKVAIMLGGPDWPIAVICGILKTSYLRNCVGMLPFIVVISPITLAGSMILMAEQDPFYSSGAAIALSVAVLIQGVTMLFALHYIEDISSSKREILDQYPVDEAVLKLDEKDLLRTRHRLHVSQWKFLPYYMRFFLITGVLAETASLYLFLLFGSKCFVQFEVVDSIDEALDGHAVNVVKTLGWVGIGLFLYGCLVLILLGRWISCKKQKTQAEEMELKLSSKIQDDPMTAGEDRRESLGTLYTNPRYQTCCGSCF